MFVSYVDWTMHLSMWLLHRCTQGLMMTKHTFVRITHELSLAEPPPPKRSICLTCLMSEWCEKELLLSGFPVWSDRPLSEAYGGKIVCHRCIHITQNSILYYSVIFLLDCVSWLSHVYSSLFIFGTHSNHVTSSNILICHTTMCRHSINFLYNKL